MNTEQAYINGFLKRASEYGLLEKGAMTLGHMKNMIRATRASGTPIIRSKAQLLQHLIGKSTQDMQDKSNDLLELLFSQTGPAYLPELGSIKPMIYMPREFGKKYPDYSPRAALLHEMGHAEHHTEDPASWRKILKMLNNSKVTNASNKNLKETIANNNAILNMRNANVPEHVINTYKNRVESPFYNTYAQNLNDVLSIPGAHKAPSEQIIENIKAKGTNLLKNLSNTFSFNKKPSYAPSTPVTHQPTYNPNLEQATSFKPNYDNPFAPITQKPIYTDPAAIEFNRPYTVQ